MRALIVIALLLPWAFNVNAQNALEVPELIRKYELASDDTARSRLLSLISFHLIRTNPDSAAQVGEQALKLAQQVGDPSAEVDAYNSLGWLALEQGLMDSAEVLLDRALHKAEALGDPKATSAVLLNLGWVYQYRGDEVAALGYFHRALPQAEAANDTSSIAVIKYTLGTTYRKAGEYQQALEYLGQSLQTERMLGRKEKMAGCLQAIANVYREKGDRTLAMSNYSQASTLYKEVGFLGGAGLVEENIGDMLLEEDPDKALVHFQAALEFYEKAGRPMDKAYALHHIGVAQMRLEHLGQAREALTEGKLLAVATRTMALVMDYERSLAKLAAKEGDGNATIAHFDRYVALKDSLQGDATQQELARLRTSFDSERKEQDNALLREKNTVQEQRLRSRELLLYGSFALVLLALTAAFLFRHNFKQKRKHATVLEKLNGELAGSHAEISEINGLLELKVLRSQMNPHFIYNCLNSAAHMTQEGKHDEALAYLQGFARLLRTMLEHSVSDRVPLEDEVEFLEQYLALEARRLPGLEYSVEVDQDLLSEDVDLPALIVQPFAENAIWHGLSHSDGKRLLRVRFNSNGAGLECTITDNGIGRERAAELHKDPGHHSLGIQLTNERLRLLAHRLGRSGSITTLDLKDDAGKSLGTQVNIRL